MRAHVFLIEGDPSNTKEAIQTKKYYFQTAKIMQIPEMPKAHPPKSQKINIRSRYPTAASWLERVHQMSILESEDTINRNMLK